jgi:hypothetical protein
MAKVIDFFPDISLHKYGPALAMAVVRTPQELPREYL